MASDRPLREKDTYILLHKPHARLGNVGDMLIIDRVKQLLDGLRPDRKYEVWNREAPFDAEQLERAAASAAVILCGGPGYQHSLYPGVYALHEDLGRIAAPILGLGLGWKAPGGDWHDVGSYRWSARSYELLERMRSSPIRSSCRDYLTVEALRVNGFDNHVMTGCPSWYCGREPTFVEPPSGPLHIAYTPGALGSRDRASLECELSALGQVRKLAAGSVTVAFHYPTDQETFERFYTRDYWNVYRRNLAPLLEHIRREGIASVNLAADLEKMRRFYAGCDLHVGYRVHAHYYFLSEGKPSVLIAEDARGRGALDALPSLGFDRSGLRRPARASILRPFRRGTGAEQALTHALDSEISQGYPRSRRALHAIRETFPAMKAFLEQLP